MSTPSLREVKKQRTRDTIVAAAARLFDEHGYDAVTVAEVAEAAEVGPRTLYRHFADKEDFLFAKDAEHHAAITRAAAGAPADATPAAILSRAVREVAALVEPDRDMLVRRARVTARTPALQAREAMKHAVMQQLFVDELVRRGHPPQRARLVAGLGIACVVEALTRWLEGPDGVTLVEAFDAVESEVAALVP
ncbi:TetR/AcrR family transcriptional regulator [Actinomycetospora aeridis]|uniref:TetR family transcriptional regulator n=1 Tax=Actinomycetospora aeridis TaxID=3129231 RepID=A0ABU8NCB5_9PSEU